MLGRASIIVLWDNGFMGCLCWLKVSGLAWDAHNLLDSGSNPLLEHLFRNPSCFFLCRLRGSTTNNRSWFSLDSLAFFLHTYSYAAWCASGSKSSPQNESTSMDYWKLKLKATKFGWFLGTTIQTILYLGPICSGHWQSVTSPHPDPCPTSSASLLLSSSSRASRMHAETAAFHCKIAETDARKGHRNL